MTYNDFAYWLQGYLDGCISPNKEVILKKLEETKENDLATLNKLTYRSPCSTPSFPYKYEVTC